MTAAFSRRPSPHAPLKLPPQSVRKLFREDFSGRSPLTVDRNDWSGESKRWSTRLRKIDGVHVTHHPGDKDSRSRTLCRFTIPDPESDGQYWRSDELRLSIDDDGRLIIESYRSRECLHAALVSDVDEIKTFVRHVLARYARRHAASKRREKVRAFKTRAILAQVKKLAQKHQFAFASSGDSVKVRLYVKLSDRDLIEIAVPFKQFEKVLPKIGTTVQSLRELHAEGLRLRMMPIGKLPWNVQWTDPGDES